MPASSTEAELAAEGAIRWIALFRGINVGGNNKLPMADLRELAQRLGFADVATYIQSGNLLLTAPAIATAQAIEDGLADAVATRFGFRPMILMRRCSVVAAALDALPFVERVNDGKQMHLFFFDGIAEAWDEAALRALVVEGEDMLLTPGMLFLLARDGIGRSKLVERLPRHLPARHTARNLNTLRAILALAGKS